MSVTKLVSTNTQRTYKMFECAYLLFVYFKGEKSPFQFKFSEITSSCQSKIILKNLY